MLRVLALMMMLLAGGVWAWPEGIPQPLDNHDAALYKKMFQEADAGRWDKASAAKVHDKILIGHVQAALYASKGYKVSFNELSTWLDKYGAYPEASEMYRLANTKRAKPTTSCKGKGKKRKCKTVGSWGPAPPLPWVMQKREIAQQAAQRAREKEYDGLSPEREQARRSLLGQSWKLRRAKKWGDAIALLDSGSARRLLSDVRWQAELVQIADAQLVPMNWKLMRAAGELGAKAEGPVRDEALWWAGYGAYRTGDYRAAAKFWDDLVQMEPPLATHAARGAYWAARAYEQTGQKGKAREMLELAARDATSYYGILASGQMGRDIRLNWQEPQLDKATVERIMAIPTAKRALALVQVGEISNGQMALRTADEDIPSAYSETFAAMALQLHLPAIAVQMGKQLYPARVVPSMLFPLADYWQPMGPVVMDRALLLGITRQESAFHPNIGSHVGAQGLMQLMPATARYIVNKTGRGSAYNLHDPQNNMTLGHDYLAYLQGKLDGDLIGMIAAYNAGPGNVNKWKNRGIAPANDPVMFVESIPIDETRGYVQKVLANVWIYESRLGKDMWSLASLVRNRWPQRWIAIKPSGNDVGG